MTELCDLAYIYGSDKCPKIHHWYTPFYDTLLRSRKLTIKKVLEIGIGNYNAMGKYCSTYVDGASLKMWKDYFPNAQIYGMDIVPEMMISEDRIETFIGDQGKQKDLDKMLEKTGKDIDFVVDDGSHLYHDQVISCEYLMSVLKEDVLYVIEDCGSNRTIERLSHKFNCSIITFPNRSEREDRLLIVNRK
jgi:hypothetical protein